MNGISNNLTASSILRASTEIKTDGVKDSANIDTKDTLVKSEQSDSKKLDFVKFDEKTKQAMIKGAAVGGVSGAVIGGIAGYASAWHEIKTTVPENSITVDWQEPNIQREMLGNIPTGFYSFMSRPPEHRINLTQEVYQNNPEMQGDKPVMYARAETFIGYGNPIVELENNDINHYTLNGWNVQRSDVDNDNDGSVDEYEYDFYPNLEMNRVGEYETPKVRFDNGGINVGLRTLAGAGIGLGIGALTGAIAGAIIENAVEK